MNPLDFTEKTVLVVGGSSGIGKAVAQMFLDHGAIVEITGTLPDLSHYDSTFGSGGKPRYSQVDFAQPAALDNWTCDFDRLDVLVMCQGANASETEEFTDAGFRKIVEINLVSMLACVTRFRPALAVSKGCIIMISSVAAFRDFSGHPAYTASKAAMLGLTRSLAKSLSAENIRVNGIAPGLIKTKLANFILRNPEALQAVLANIPANRIGDAAEIAGVVMFLASPLASYICGHTVVVDGGMMI
jgi:3-oxoacyl-[acyl-carrier protein] reductase